MRKFSGSCHCGNIGFTFLWPGDDIRIPVRKCNCDYCSKFSGTYTSHPEAELDVHITDKKLITRYVFGTKTAEFYICNCCGIMPFVTSQIEENTYAVVNTNTFDNVSVKDFDETSTDFNNEQTGQRLHRRKNTWIPQVRINKAIV